MLENGCQCRRAVLVRGVAPPPRSLVEEESSNDFQSARWAGASETEGEAELCAGQGKADRQRAAVAVLMHSVHIPRLADTNTEEDAAKLAQRILGAVCAAEDGNCSGYGSSNQHPRPCARLARRVPLTSLAHPPRRPFTAVPSLAIRRRPHRSRHGCIMAATSARLLHSSPSTSVSEPPLNPSRVFRGGFEHLWLSRAHVLTRVGQLIIV